MQGRLIEQLKVVPAIAPKDTTGAGQDGDWVNLKKYRRLLIWIQQGAWAGGTPAVTLEQARDNTGTGAKTLGFTERWSFVGLTSDDPVRSAVTGNTFNLTAVANTTTLIEVLDTDLDVNGGFTHVRVRTASPGANADLIFIGYILGGGDFSGDPQDLPSVIN